MGSAIIAAAGINSVVACSKVACYGGQHQHTEVSSVFAVLGKLIVQ